MNIKRMLGLFVLFASMLSSTMPWLSVQAESVDDFNVLTTANAELTVMSSNGTFVSSEAFDNNFFTSASVTDYDGVPIFDVNGESGDDYCILMTVKTLFPVNFDHIRIYYNMNESMYLDKPVMPFPSGFEIYSGNNGTWQKIYKTDTLKDKLITEKNDKEYWTISNTDLKYFSFDVGKQENLSFIRFAIKGVEPWLENLNFSEIQLLADESMVPTGFNKLTLKADTDAKISISGKYFLGNDYVYTGQNVEVIQEENSIYEITSVKLNGKNVIKNASGKYVVSMPNKASTITVDTKLKSGLEQALEVVSIEANNEERLKKGDVPQITYTFNNEVDFIDKNKILINNEHNTGLIQHAFVDCNDARKVYVILYRDKLSASETYTISLSDKIKSVAGNNLIGNSSCVFTTGDDYASDFGVGSYIKGYGDGTFRPENNISKNEALIMAERVAPDRDYSTVVDSDDSVTKLELARILYIIKYNKVLSSDELMFSALIKAGIIRSDDYGVYGRDDVITRADAVVLFNRTIGRCSRNCDIINYAVMPFSDVPIDDVNYNNILVATQVLKYSSSIPWTENILPKEFDEQNSRNSVWTQIPVVSQRQKDLGISGGEGGQWLQSIEVSGDGQLLFAGVDVNAMLRSTDGGSTWHRSNRGFLANGCVDTAIDPNNKNRVLAIGSCGSYKPQENGIYLSENMGETWSHVHSRRMDAQRDSREQLAWDKSSYDATIGGSRIAYWSSLWRITDNVHNTPPVHKSDEVGGLFKTEDGGKTWFLVNEEMSDGYIEVNPENGWVYVGNDRGFHISKDGGKTFTTIISNEPILSVDVIPSKPNNVYINDSQSVMVSKDGGNTFTRIRSNTFPGKSDFSDLRNITMGLQVSPANPDYMLVDKRDFINYANKRYVSHDGGKTWTECAYDTSKDFFFAHNRQHVFAWHPEDENKVWSLGGDWIVSSNDGGYTFLWDAEGCCGVPPASRMNFNPYNPDLIYAGSQDLFGIKSMDRGNTWEPIENSGKYWNSYGSYAVDENLLFAGLSDGWYNPRYLGVSRDGGKTWTDTGLYLKDGTAKWASSFWQSPKNPAVLFAGEYASYDRGETWTEMNGVSAVMAVNYYHNHEIYGAEGDCIKVSYDDGKTWLPFVKCKLDWDADENPEVWDVEYDGINDILYYAVGSWASAISFAKVKNNVHTNIGKNLVRQEKTNTVTAQLIAIDPRYPNVVYIGGYTGRGMSTVGVQRSCDGGETFYNICSMGDESSVVKDGPSAGVGPAQLIVEPDTGYLWMWDAGQGWWKFAPPYDNTIY